MALCLTLGLMPCAGAQDVPLPTEAPPDTEATPPPPAPQSVAPAQSTVSPPAQQDSASPLENAVRLSPAPGVSVLIPKGWFACDDATNQLLGGAKLPIEFTSQMCGKAAPTDPSFRVVNPSLSQLVIVLASDMTDAHITPKVFDHLAGKELQNQGSALCATVLASQNLTATDCNFVLGSVAGHAALVGRFSGIHSGGGMTMRARLTEIPFDKRMFIFVLIYADTDPLRTEPLADAIMNSLEID